MAFSVKDIFANPQIWVRLLAPTLCVPRPLSSLTYLLCLDQQAELVASGFAFVACLITFFSIRQHLRYNKQPAIRNYIIRILLVSSLHHQQSATHARVRVIGAQACARRSPVHPGRSQLTSQLVPCADGPDLRDRGVVRPALQ